VSSHSGFSIFSSHSGRFWTPFLVAPAQQGRTLVTHANPALQGRPRCCCSSNCGGGSGQAGRPPSGRPTWDEAQAAAVADADLGLALAVLVQQVLLVLAAVGVGALAQCAQQV
jgi:hypothetical protein